MSHDESAATTRVDAVLSELRRRDERVTPARRGVIEVLAATDAHLAADDIAVRIQRRRSGVHRTTVYRTLERLCEIGVVTHVHLGHGGATYHLRAHGGDGSSAHLHAQCAVCGQVEDAPGDLLDDAAATLVDRLGFRLVPNHAALLGVCHRCDSPPAGT